MRLTTFTAARALACAGLALCAWTAPAAAQEQQPADPVRIEVAGDDIGVGRLAAGVLAALQNNGVRPTRGIFLLRADSANANLSGSFAGSDVPQAAFAHARPAIAAFLRERPGSGPFHVSFRLSEETLAVVGGEWDWRWDQAPEVRNDARVQELLNRLAGVTSDQTGSWERDTQLLLLVSPAGKVVVASVEIPSGDWGVDQYLMNLAYEMRWNPARKDGQPVPGWMRYRFGLRRY
ncbi:MAG TPA: hypothetical protein VF746_03785 [Longimicrobium sp.]|jgi:hypothetical protein